MDGTPISGESSLDASSDENSVSTVSYFDVSSVDTWDDDHGSDIQSDLVDLSPGEQDAVVSELIEDSSDSSSGPARYTINLRSRARHQGHMENNLERTSTSAEEVIAPPSDNSSSHPSLTLPVLVDEAKINEPPNKMRKMSSPLPNNDEGDGETCPICLDSWGNSGDHRLVALKCGHLFGSKCVEKWIRGKGSKDRSCPTCKSKAAVKDIRYIYARRLVAVDTSELTALQKQVETVKMEKNKIHMELQTTKVAQRSLALQLDLLKKTIATDLSNKQQLPKRNWRFALDKNLDVWRDGGCRVLAYNCRTYDFYVSQKTTNSLFPGYGVRTVSTVDYKLGPFIHLHPKAIRDVAYSQPTDLLMSVGLDSTVRIVERGIPTTVIQCAIPLWSCAWDHVRNNQLYVGGVGGIVIQYDVRNTGTPMQTFSSPGDMSPSVSLCSTQFGLLSCQLNSCWLWRPTQAGTEPQALPLKGPFMSMCYDSESQRAVVSCRPGSAERARLALFKLQKSISSGEVSFELIQNIAGSARSTLMSRAAWVQCPDASWVAAYSESDSSLFLHAVEGGRTMALPAAEAALDVCAGRVNGDTVLAALSESRLRLYRAVATSS